MGKNIGKNISKNRKKISKYSQKIIDNANSLLQIH